MYHYYIVVMYHYVMVSCIYLIVCDLYISLILQFPMNPVGNANRNMDFWSNGVNQMQYNQTQSTGYSLAQDFAMHSNNNSTPNIGTLGHPANTSNITNISTTSPSLSSGSGPFH